MVGKVICTLVRKIILGCGGNVDKTVGEVEEDMVDTPDPPPHLCHAFRITQHAARVFMSRWPLRTWQVVGPLVKVYKPGVSSRLGAASKTYTTREMVEWWRGEILELLNAAVEARGRLGGEEWTGTTIISENLGI